VTEFDEICEEAIGGARPLGAAADFIEACRLYLTQRKFPEDQFSIFFGRLGEALLHRGWREHAVECARIAFELRPEREDVADLSAWVFSNCGRYEAAAAAYERLLQIRPRWAEGHRHMSGSLAAAGQLDRAILHGGMASNLDPHSFEFAVHAAGLCETAGRYEDAVGYLARAAGISPGVSTVLRRMSGLKFALEEPEEAVALALRALSLAPGDRQNALHAGELLLRAGRFGEAVDIIGSALDINPRDEVALRLLSAAQMLRGRITDALEAIDQAIAIASEIAEYHLHRANLLYRAPRRGGRGVRSGGCARSIQPRRQALPAHGLFRQRPLYRGARRRRRADPRRAGKRGICAGGAAGIEPPVRNLGRRLRCAQRARVATEPGAASGSGLFRDIAHPRAGHPCPDNSRDPNPVRRLQTRIRLGIARTDRAHPDAVPRIRGDDARSAADRR
jgi:tetratricopeptide (TPR) repeat protein